MTSRKAEAIFCRTTETGFENEGTQHPQPGITLSERARRLVAENIGLVGLHLQRRVPTPGEPQRDREFEDLFQEGCLALILAAIEYNPERNGAFVPFAIFRIRRRVYLALHDRFTLMRVPVNRRSAETGSQNTSCSESIGQIPPDTMLYASECVASDGETLRHRFHRRYKRALQMGLRDLKNRPWPRRNPAPILDRLVSERLLITQECMRTPLRQIAREFGISSGRTIGYEQRLTEAAERHLREDPQLQVLMRWIKENHGGFDTVLDDELRRDLKRAEDQAFHAHFTSLEKPEQAALIYDLLERTETALGEVACNLHRMARGSGDEDLCEDAVYPPPTRKSA